MEVGGGMETQIAWRNRIKETRLIGAAELQSNPANWRRHPQAQARALRGLLSEVGIVAPLLAYESARYGGLTLIDGHMRQETGGEWPVTVLDVSDEEADLILATFDPVTGLAEMDAGALAALLGRVQMTPVEDEGVKDLLAQLAQQAGGEPQPSDVDAEAQIDRAEELRQKWQVESGQLWQLGEHRLICGDCTDATLVERLLAGEKVDLVITSPPYNRGTSTGGGFGHSGLSQQLTDGYKGYSDDLPVEEYRQWQARLLASWWELLADTGAIFYNHRPRIQAGLYETPLAWNPGLPIRQIVIWHSGAGVNFNATHYRVAHEWIVIFAKPDFRLVSKGISGIGDVWQFGTEKMEGHPAPFPLDVPHTILETTNSQVIYEPFCGSGTTVIACEQLGRKCRAVELSPAYVAVALQRYEDATGQTPMLLTASWEAT